MNKLRKISNRLLQIIAYNIPGARSLRIKIHKMRGVKIQNNVFIGQRVHIDSTAPNKVYVGNNTQISINVTIIAHFRELKQYKKTPYSVIIEDDVFIGPGVIILPSVRIGKGSLIAAGSVVSNSIPDYTFAIGNPAIGKAKIGKPLREGVSYAEFIRHLKPF